MRRKSKRVRPKRRGLADRAAHDRRQRPVAGCSGTGRTSVSGALGGDVPSQSLSGPLGALKSPDYNRILHDVERVISGDRVNILTTFTDPMMKSFVRFMGNLDKTALMPPAPVLEAAADEG